MLEGLEILQRQKHSNFGNSVRECNLALHTISLGNSPCCCTAVSKHATDHQMHLLGQQEIRTNMQSST